VFAGGIDLALFGFAGLVMGIAGAIIYFEGGFVVGAAVVWFAWVVYSIGAFGAGGGIGMQLTGLRVVNVRTGREPGPVRAAIRLAVSVPSLWLLGIGYLWMIGDRNKQAWHDKAAGTVVVRDVIVFGESQAAPP
jgi:uncharacterized RDD family membrane protein YckC